MYYIIGLCILLLCLGMICSKQNIFSPTVITAMIWFVCVTLFLYFPHQLPELSSQFSTAIAIWLVCFSLCSLLMQSCCFSTSTIKCNVTIRDIYFWLSITCIPCLILFAQHAIATGTTDHWALNLRNAAIGRGENQEAYTPLYYLLWVVTYLLYLVEEENPNTKRTIIMGLLVALFGAVTMSKTLILNLFIMTIFILYTRRIIKIRHILIGIAAIVTVLLIMQGVRQAVTMDKNATQSTIVLYILSNMSAFDTLQPYSSEHFGENVFRIYYAITYKLGLSDIVPVNPILPWIEKPIATNTYTTLYPFFKDFGYIGIGIFGSLLGLFYGWIFKKHQENCLFYTIMYAYFCTLLVTQYNGDGVFTNIAGHVKMLLILCVPFVVDKYKLLRR